MKQYSLVLSVDAGGIRSPIIAGTLLSRLEERLGKRSVDVFDVFTGTSGGALVAAASATGMSAKDIKNLADKLGDDVFSRSLWRRIRTVNGILGPKYSGSGLRSVLKSVFYNMNMSDIPKPLCVQVTDLLKNEALVLKSHKNKQRKDLTKVRDVLYATSAAPTYFPFHKERYCDGALFAYSPVLVGYSEAKSLWPDREVIVLSIGSGYAELPWEVPNRNPRDMIKKILESSLEGQGRVSEHISQRIPDCHPIRISPFVRAGMDDISKTTKEELVSSAEEWFQAIDSFCEILTSSELVF